MIVSVDVSVLVMGETDSFTINSEAVSYTHLDVYKRQAVFARGSAMIAALFHDALLRDFPKEPGGQCR